MEQDKIASLDWEEWRDIPWYEWYYMVSNMGRVKSFHKWWNWKILKSRINNRWYCTVELNINWLSKVLFVHRIVASAFLWLDITKEFDMKNIICVCHKDDNPLNNSLENLFLWSMSDNALDMYKKWRWWNKKWKYNPSSKIIYQYDKELNLIWEWYGARDINRKLWFSFSHINNCCNGSRRTSNGYIWRYEKIFN